MSNVTSQGGRDIDGQPGVRGRGGRRTPRGRGDGRRGSAPAVGAFLGAEVTRLPGRGVNGNHALKTLFYESHPNRNCGLEGIEFSCGS